MNFIDLDDQQFKETFSKKNTKKKMELPMEAAMPCKQKTFRTTRKSKHTYVVAAHKST